MEDKMKPVKFCCERDGLTIRGSVFGISQERRPAVILSHGFLANSKMCKTYAKLLASMGYVSVIFDFCGGGLMSSSDGRSEDMTLFTEVEDLKAVISYMKTQPYVIPERISLLGCSQGGVVSAFVAKEDGFTPEKLILLYPALCIPDDARKGKMMFYSFDPANIPDILGSLPMKLAGAYASEVIDMDIFTSLKGYEGEVLYLHGTKDNIVDISYARRASEIFPQREYHEIEGGGHMFKGRADEEACGYIKAFMEL